MSEASAAEPIKVGFLIDYLGSRCTDWTPFAEPLDLVFRDGLESSMIDRPVEIVYRGAQGLPKGTVKAVIDAFGATRRRGVCGRHRSAHQRQRGCGASRDRTSVPGARHQRVRVGGLAREVDVPVEQRLDDRRADPVGAPDGEGGSADRRCARRTFVHRAGVSAELPARRAVRRHPDRRRGVHRADGTGHHRRGRGAASCGREHDRALRLRAGCRGDQCRAAGAGLGSASVHGNRVRDGLQRAVVGRLPGLDRLGAVRRGQPGGPGSSSTDSKPSTAIDPSTTARCCGATARWRCSTRSPMPRRCHHPASGRRSSGSRCCPPRAVRPEPGSRSAVGCIAAGWAPATSSPARWIPTARSSAQFWKSSLVGRYGEQ